jgi:hypothetical protein
MADKQATVAQAKALGFDSNKGITIKDNMFVFDKSLAPDRGGFGSVGVAKPGQVQMTPYYGDVTGAYKLTQEQFGGAYTAGGGSKNTPGLAKIMQENEINSLVASGVSLAEATKKVSSQYGEFGVPLIEGSNITSSNIGGYDASGKPMAGGQYNAQGQYIGTGTGGISSERRDAFQAIINALAPYNLEGLAATVEQLMKDPSVGPNTATFKLKYDTSINPTTGKPWNTAYQTRFPANTERINAGKPALSESEYLTAERTYAQVLTSYGVGNLATKANFNKFIAGDVSATEVGDRVATAIDRVQNASAVTKDALAKYYPKLSQLDVVSAVLDPTIGVPELKRKIQLAEIGGAATLLGAGLTPEERNKLILSETRAGELAAAGITGEQARKGYEAIGGGLERGRQLASIYQQESYNQQIAEAEIFGLQDSVMASQRRKKLIGLETAQFGAKSGLASGALKKDSAGQF